MAEIRKFSRTTKSVDSKIGRSAASVLLLLIFSVSIIPFALTSIVFYWLLPASTKVKFKAFTTMVNHYLTELLIDFEKGGSNEKAPSED